MVEATEVIFGSYTTAWSYLGAFAAEVASVGSIYQDITALTAYEAARIIVDRAATQTPTPTKPA